MNEDNTKNVKAIGIKYACPNCNKVISFPACPNALTCRFEKLAFAIYSCHVNNKTPCWDCRGKLT